MFDARKKIVMSKVDHSKKGSVDKEVKPLLDVINSKPFFYTTSSCAGRIVLLKSPKSGKKKDAEWLFVSHGVVGASIKDKLKNLPDDLVWLKMESFILHVCVKDLEIADRLMNTLRCVGLKHSGILNTRKRIIVEIITNDRMDVPISKDKTMLVSQKYFEFLIDLANKKLMDSRKRMEKLKDALIDFN